MEFQLEQIQEMIYVIRGQRVMLDSGLAKLYGVETKRLNEQVRRNIDRLEKDTNAIFKVVFERLDNLKTELPSLPHDRIKIGFVKDEDE